MTWMLRFVQAAKSEQSHNFSRVFAQLFHRKIRGANGNASERRHGARDEIIASYSEAIRGCRQPSPVRLADRRPSRPNPPEPRGLTISIRDRSCMLMIWEICLACRIGNWHPLFNFFGRKHCFVARFAGYEIVRGVVPVAVAALERVQILQMRDKVENADERHRPAEMASAHSPAGAILRRRFVATPSAPRCLAARQGWIGGRGL